MQSTQQPPSQGGQMQQLIQQTAVATSTSSSGVQLNTKYIFGLKGDVKNNLHYIDDQRVLYPAGHNVIIYNLEDKSQQYIQGVEGSEGITAIAVSPPPSGPQSSAQPYKRFVAVCEKSERAICLIWDISGVGQSNPIPPKRKKILTSADYQSKEFISVAFAPSADKALLATLTGEPDWKIILWIWDKQKCFTYQQVGVTGNMLVNQCSFHNQDHTIVLVTGNNTYKYYRVQENNSLKATHTQIVKKEAHISNNFTCHTWLPDGRLIVCTDQGEIMLLESSGDYKMLLAESPGEGFYIECIITYSKGFIIAGENGQIMIYEKSEEPKNPYHRIATLPSSSDSKQEKDYPQLQAGIMSSRVRALALSSSEDNLIFTTENNQVLKVAINIERPSDDAKYEYLLYPFHSRAVHGMDVCIKKYLVATCSIDKTVRIWNYNTKTLEICETFQDEAFSLAFHPSGFHIIVGFTDKVRMMNVFQKTLKTFKEIPIKGCREIRFSNGGHLFACTNQHNISVYKFYTAENPPEFNFKAHIGKVRCIQWLDDDSGFISGGWDGSVFLWKLYIDPNAMTKDGQKVTNPICEFKLKNVNFSCVAFKPESKTQYFAVGTDKTIKEINGNKEVYPRYDAGVNVSQIVLMHGGRALFAGVAEDDKPGSIQVLKYPFEAAKSFEVQAHSLPVERLRISFDSQTLFSAGQDGLFCIFEVKDKDPKGKKEKENIQIIYSDEILIPKAERDKFQADIEHLKQSIEQLRINNEIKVEHELSKKNQRIQSLHLEIENKEIENRNRYEALLDAKKEMERMNEEKIQQMTQAHQIELERRKQDYNDKMEADAMRYQELLNQKQEEAERFEQRLNELFTHHKKIIKELQQEQKIELEQQIKETNRLKEEIEQMMMQHKSQRDKIENDAWDRIDQIKEKNKEELAKIIDAGMQSKANLTLITNDYKEAKSKKEQLQRDIHEKQTKLNDLVQQTNSLRQQIQSQKGELNERNTTIKDKDKRIYDLKKKTQELEKFKFVLDYKIKELKRDIGPRELEIQKLNEQTNKMRQELKHFNRVNQNLALIVDDLRMRQEGLTNEVTNLRQQLEEQESYKKKFKDDVFECLHHIADFKKLKKGVIRLHKKYVKEEVKNEQGDTDLHREYANKRRYLENNVNYLRQMLQKDQDVHKQENSRIMKENVTLLQEINDLKKEQHTLKSKLRMIGMNIGDQTMGSTQRSKLDMSMRSIDKDGSVLDVQKELKMQDVQISELQKQIIELEELNEMIRNQRPRVGKLPPLEASQQLEQQEHFDQDGGQYEDEEDSPLKAQPGQNQSQMPGQHHSQHETLQQLDDSPDRQIDQDQ